MSTRSIGFLLPVPSRRTLRLRPATSSTFLSEATAVHAASRDIISDYYVRGRNSQVVVIFVYEHPETPRSIRRGLHKKDFQRTSWPRGSLSSCALTLLSLGPSPSSSKCFRFPAILARLRERNVWVIKFPFSAFGREHAGTKQRNESRRGRRRW